MAEKKKSVDEAIEEVVDEAEGGLGEVKDSLAKAQQSMEKAKVAMQGAYGKARDRVAEIDFKEKGDQVVEYVRKNPGKAILIALAVGFVVGYATRPRD
jgi:ElaB/YqjD/DUF883 family membrane-anchored ribosome-binding protein